MSERYPDHSLYNGAFYEYGSGPLSHLNRYANPPQGEKATGGPEKISGGFDLASDELERRSRQFEERGVTERVVTDAETGGRKGQKLAQFSQIPPDVLRELAEHFGKGMAKYPDDEEGRPNWQRGYSWRLSVDAMERHFNAWQQGEDFDPETGTSHLVCAIWHLMVLRWFELHGKGKDYR